MNEQRRIAKQASSVFQVRGGKRRREERRGEEREERRGEGGEGEERGKMGDRKEEE